MNSTAPVYNFTRQLEIGQKCEDYLDAYFVWRVDRIHKATETEQRLGIDRLFSEEGRIYSVEYKSDLQAARTGNFYIETVSAEGRQKGWLYTSKANFIIFFIPQTGLLYKVQRNILYKFMADGGHVYPIAKAENEGYRGVGRLVPVREIARIASDYYLLPPMVI